MDNRSIPAGTVSLEPAILGAALAMVARQWYLRTRTCRSVASRVPPVRSRGSVLVSSSPSADAGAAVRAGVGLRVSFRVNRTAGRPQRDTDRLGPRRAAEDDRHIRQELA